jgi:membrane protease YdiL (CAAX protease family)
MILLHAALGAAGCAGLYVAEMSPLSLQCDWFGQAHAVAPASAPPADDVRMVAACAIAVATALVAAFAARRFIRKSSADHAAIFALRDRVVGRTFLTTGLTVTFGALAEELLFRGALNVWLGVVPATLLFALLHSLPVMGNAYRAAAGALGIVAAGLTAWTGTLLPAAILHMTVNLMGAAYLFEFKAPAHTTRTPLRPRQ